MMKQSFSIARLWFLLRGDFLAEWRIHAAIFGVVAAVTFLISTQQRLDGSAHPSFYRTLFNHALFIWGLWATSVTFRSLHDQTRQKTYLLLPASPLEKLIARLLPLTVGICIILPIGFLFLSVVIELFNLIIYGSRRALFNPFDPAVRKLYDSYIIFQSVFFLGAVWFQRFAFLKTVLLLVLIHVGLALLVLAAVYLASGSFSWYPADIRGVPLSSLHTESFNLADFMLYAVMGNTIPRFLIPDREILATLFHGGLFLLPLVLWWVAWLRLKEAQINGGV